MSDVKHSKLIVYRLHVGSFVFDNGAADKDATTVFVEVVIASPDATFVRRKLVFRVPLIRQVSPDIRPPNLHMLMLHRTLGLRSKMC